MGSIGGSGRSRQGSCLRLSLVDACQLDNRTPDYFWYVHGFSVNVSVPHAIDVESHRNRAPRAICLISSNGARSEVVVRDAKLGVHCVGVAAGRIGPDIHSTTV